MANVSIPWDTGERTIDLANIRLKKGQMELTALVQLGASAGTLISDYRQQSALDDAADIHRKNELAVLAEEDAAQKAQAAQTPTADAASANKDAVQPVNASGQG